MKKINIHIKPETKMIVKEENDDSDAECNEYEEIRNRNAMANLQLLNDLRLLSEIDKMIPKHSEVSQRKHHIIKKRKLSTGLQPVRKSVRLAGKESSNSSEIKEESISEIKGEPTEELHDSVLRKFYTGPEHMIRITDDHNDVKPSCDNLLPLLKEEAIDLALEDQLKSMDRFKERLEKLILLPENIKKVGTSKTYSMVIHPTKSKLLIITGDGRGYLSFWDVDNMNKEVDIYHPHKNCIYCLSVCAYNPMKLYATALDGVVRECDLEKMQFNDIYITENNDHTVYHEQLCPYTLLVSHGCGEVAMVDLRESKKVSRWIKCHARSVRTIHRHPFMQHEFVTSSGIGEVGIWDIRQQKNQKPLLLIPHPKALKSAFFSPGGGMLLTACNDNYIRVYSSDKNHLLTKISHDMQTGRWIRPFVPIWHPLRDDSFIVGSMQKPRQVNIYGIHGRTLHSLKSPYLQTILSNNCFHAAHEIVAGANNSGFVHVFRASE